MDILELPERLKDITIDVSLGEPKPDVNIEAQKEYEKSERNRKLIWLGFGAIVVYFAYISFIKK